MKWRMERVILSLAVLLTVWEMILSSLIPLSPYLHVWVDHHGEVGLEAHSHWHAKPATAEKKPIGVPGKNRRVRGVTWHDSSAPTHPDQARHSHDHERGDKGDSGSDHHHRSLSQVFAAGAVDIPGSTDFTGIHISSSLLIPPGAVIQTSWRLIHLLLAPRPPPHISPA
ncbi:MAG: hypothetical protein LR011_04110 [Verrucomicrobia bacterium]|nr:hypothetical protein [Verrucomicrobiota bacterium]